MQELIVQHLAMGFCNRILLSWRPLQRWPFILKSSPLMIHGISTLTFIFHLLLTIETWYSTITWIRESRNRTYASWHITASAWAPTSSNPNRPIGAIVIFPEALGVRWEALPDISLGDRGASRLPLWCSASYIPEEQVFTHAAPHDQKCWLVVWAGCSQKCLHDLVLM